MKWIGLISVAMGGLLTFAEASPDPIGSIVAECPQSGTRTVSGTYDDITGAVDFTVALDACLDAAGVQHDGTVTITGVAAFEAKVAGNVVNFKDLTYVFNTTEVLAPVGTCKAADGEACPLALRSGGTSQRGCIWVKNGTFDLASQEFTGTLTKNSCTVNIKGEYEPAGVFEHVVNRSTLGETN